MAQRAVQPSKSFDRSGNEALDLKCLRNICLNENNLAAEALDIVLGPLASLKSSYSDHNSGGISREQVRGSPLCQCQQFRRL